MCICAATLFLAGCSKQKTAEEKQASCQSSIKIVQENAVGDAVMAIADLYKRTNDPLACAGKDWSDRGLPFDIWQTSEIYKKQGIWLENCDKETIERDLPLGIAEMRFIFNHRIYNKKAKEDFRECRARLVYEPE
jgi:hypothetical protein